MYLHDPRITTEPVDQLPASATIPTPLDSHGRIVGTPGELIYARDIHRNFEALDAASERVKVWTIGQSEEGREMYVLAVADEATIADLDRYRKVLADLTDPRKTGDERARALIATGKPNYRFTTPASTLPSMAGRKWSRNAPIGRRCRGSPPAVLIGSGSTRVSRGGSWRTSSERAGPS